MMRYTLAELIQLQESSLACARAMLASLPIADGTEPEVTGLTGWVFEQTVRNEAEGQQVNRAVVVNAGNALMIAATIPVIALPRGES